MHMILAASIFLVTGTTSTIAASTISCEISDSRVTLEAHVDVAPLLPVPTLNGAIRGKVKLRGPGMPNDKLEVERSLLQHWIYKEDLKLHFAWYDPSGAEPGVDLVIETRDTKKTGDGGASTLYKGSYTLVVRTRSSDRDPSVTLRGSARCDWGP
jgi:hypothetical protein